MTNEELRIAVAVEMGWSGFCNDRERVLGSKTAYDPLRELPNYPEDWNTRKEMLAVLDLHGNHYKAGERRDELIEAILGKRDPWPQVCWSDGDLIKLLTIDQPDFCRAWLKVKGKL